MASQQLSATPQVPVLQLFSLKGKTALVTGASRGIGASVAIALAQAGAHVILHFRSPETNRTTYDTILHHQTQDSTTEGADIPPKRKAASIVYADLTSKEETRSLVDNALDVLKKDTDGDLSRIDILVHAAGIQRRAPAVAFKDDDWEEVISVNLSSAFHLAKAVANHMLSTPSTAPNNNPSPGGKIILLGSLLTFQGGLTVPAYAAAKGGIGQLTKALSNEWSKLNINVNCICPGYINTDMNEALLKDETRSRQIGERIPAGRWGHPWDFAGPVVWLASGASKYVCGECVVVDGVRIISVLRLTVFH
ncbi:hypothetical protein FRC17_002676 [Serendipita sp. 399]|nr:hypothetical protein FRC17_002676 [Serendipita sp. 399]